VELVTSPGATMTELTVESEVPTLPPVVETEDPEEVPRSATLPKADCPAITPTTSEQANPKLNARNSCFMDPVIISITESVKEFFEKFFVSRLDAIWIGIRYPILRTSRRLLSYMRGAFSFVMQ
jgi:hypothetical protein